MTGMMLVFGIFFTLSCTSLQTTSKNAETLYNENNYRAALETIDNEILEDPDNSEKKILKARILNAHAMNDRGPSDRNQLYNNLRNTVDEIQFSTDQFNTETDSILNTAWLHEQSEGVRYLQQNGPDNFDLHFDRVISHFSNAITIIPDSLVTYNLKATTYYRHGDLTKAIETLESIEDKGFNRPPDTCEKLAYLYLEAGMIDRSIEIYEGLASNYPESEIYRQGLVNAYILGDNHQKSIELLETLSEEFPNRAEYREALATERFYQLKNEADDLKLESNESDRTLGEIEYFSDSLNEITGIYHDVDGALPSTEERKQRIAEFHLSAADLLTGLAGTNQESELNQLAASESEMQLRHAIPYLIALFESNADNVVYARKLIDLYNDLDMDDEAEALERQINL
ncbi:hypothetical protein BH23BAC3_BH23BAC3_10580 [soil metagenome]